MRPIKEIQTQINGTIRNNLPKMVISIVALRFLSTIAITLIAAPVSLVFLLDTGSLLSSVMMLASSILSEIVTVFLMYGFFVLLGRFYRDERAVIGYLFQAFRDWKRMLLVTLIVCGVTLVLAFATAFPSLKIIQYFKGDEIRATVIEEIAKFPEDANIVLGEGGLTLVAESAANVNADQVSPSSDATGDASANPTVSNLSRDEMVVVQMAMRMYDEFIKYLPFFLVPYLILFVLILVRYAFVFPILFHEPEITVRQAMKKSRLLLKKKNFKLIWFCIRCSFYPILATVVCYVATLFIKVDILLTIVSLLYQVALYFSIIVIILSVNAFYYEHADPETLCISSPTEQDVN